MERLLCASCPSQKTERSLQGGGVLILKSSTTPGATRRILRKGVSAVLLPLVLTFALANVVVWLLGPQWPPIPRVPFSIPKSDRVEPIDINWLEPSPTLGWTNAPTPGLPFDIDNRGYRVVENVPDSDFTVLCLGDSCTFGIHVDDAGHLHFDSWPDALQARFNAMGIPATVVNAGVLGYSIHNGLRVLETYHGDLDAVVVRFGCNDHADAPRLSLCPDSLGITASLIRVPLFRAIYRVTGDLHLNERLDEPMPAVSLERFATLLERIGALTTRRGARLFVVDFPLRQEGESAGPLGWRLMYMKQGLDVGQIRAIHAEYQRAAKDTASRIGAPWVTTGLNDVHFSELDVVHPNAEGMERIAQAVFESIRGNTP